MRRQFDGFARVFEPRGKKADGPSVLDRPSVLVHSSEPIRPSVLTLIIIYFTVLRVKSNPFLLADIQNL